MTHVPFEQYNFQISANTVYDIARKKRVPFTPEELVRQTILHYLVHTQKIGLSLIAVERKLLINQQTKRFDLVVFNRQGKPFILVECKSPEVNINVDTFLQSGNYNAHLEAEFIWLSNGKTNFFISIKKQIVLSEVPELLSLL